VQWTQCRVKEVGSNSNIGNSGDRMVPGTG
jgi:hypothetical protein